MSNYSKRELKTTHKESSQNEKKEKKNDTTVTIPQKTLPEKCITTNALLFTKDLGYPVEVAIEGL